ncbi:tripartite tricarboxylate transporter substrate binding protein [Methylocella sp. CPCC 101449]|uniref:Bug family tripartite tricarboxylate transporter substrate binding protein n=1 Tax=Methylocella sp. CPCC 101449 TaxID=2987531 RepID=UPI00288FB9FA|nr:tripartite tricarboxylate transporter substrate binding protein [Methylocella sp. CPCC 101449]MDT2020288.1 tripartite tricarboxylate transporter substrate binding protein [Methylocella sp. CPCC 101449]
MHFLVRGLVLAAWAGGATVASAQTFPNKPVRFIAPFAAGGPADTIARVVAEKMQANIGQPVVIDNRAGAGGAVGTRAVAQADPDGYTIGISTAGALAISVSMQEAIGYDPRKDLRALTLAASVPELLVVGTAVPTKTLPELIALAKAKPNTLNFASSGPGSMPHLAGELLKQYGKIEMTHVPYRGAAPAVNDLLSGQVDLMFMDIAVLLPHVQAGTMRAVAIGSAKRSPSLPDLPTTAELGLPQVVADNWYGIVAPPATPQPIVDRLHAILVEALNAPETKEKLGLQGAIVVANKPDEFAAYIRSEIDKWAEVVKTAGVKAN